MKVKLYDPIAITIRPDRQRKDLGDLTELKESIIARGQLQPIIIEEAQGEEDSRSLFLVAGERRLTAIRELGLKVEASLLKDLTPLERELVELEENVKRKDLPWKNEVAAVKRIHQLYAVLNGEGWTQEATATEIGMGGGILSVMLRVAEELENNNPAIAEAGGYRSAYNIIARKDDRLIDDAMNDLLAPAEPEPPPAPLDTKGRSLATTKPALAVVPRVESILQLDFHSWAESYSGPLFNFLHIDFPYGIDHDKSDQGGSTTRHESYADSPDVYWKLLETLVRNLDKIMTQSGHMLFWLSSDIMGETGQYETIKFFRSRASSLTVQTVPIVWHKTDNKGILPDPKRQPRRVTETALIISRGDRFLVKSVSNAYGSPTTKEIHQSEKPEPMLRHFFQMFVDDNTRMLDPTCGSGTSLRAAESLGATSVLGLEINPDFVEASRIALRKFRSLRATQKKE